VLDRQRPLTHHVQVDQHAGRVQVVDGPVFRLVVAALVDALGAADAPHARLQLGLQGFEEAVLDDLDVRIEEQRLALQVQIVHGPGHAGTVVDVVAERDELDVRETCGDGTDLRRDLGTRAVDHVHFVRIELAEGAQQRLDQVGRVV